MSTGNHTAPEGQVYVCGACGKRSRDRYGDKRIDRGWDVSCMMHAVLCYEERTPDGTWRAVPERAFDERGRWQCLCYKAVNPHHMTRCSACKMARPDEESPSTQDETVVE